MTELSIVVPVFNEEESLRTLYGEIDEVVRSLDANLELIFIDDGSTDASWSIVAELAQKDPRVRGIRFRRNFGKAAALDVGLHAATKPIVMTMDADLQDDPHEIPDFLRLMDEGFDCVSGWKQTRHDPWHKVIPSHIFNKMVSSLTGVKLHDHNCGMKCYRREIFDEISLYGELHRFIPALAGARGWKVGEKIVNHRARKFGHSKYGFTRFIKGFLDLLSVKFVTSYGTRPRSSIRRRSFSLARRFSRSASSPSLSSRRTTAERGNIPLKSERTTRIKNSFSIFSGIGAFWRLTSAGRRLILYGATVILVASNDARG